MADQDTTRKIIDDAVAAIAQRHQEDMEKARAENRELTEENSNLKNEIDVLKEQLAQKMNREVSQQKKIDFITKAATADPGELNAATVAEWFREDVAPVAVRGNESDPNGGHNSNNDGVNVAIAPEGIEQHAPTRKRGRPSTARASGAKHGFDRFADKSKKISVCFCGGKYLHLRKHIKFVEGSGESRKCKFCEMHFSSATLGPHEEGCNRKSRPRRK